MCLKQKLFDQLKNVPDDYIILVELSPEHSFELTTALVKYFSDKKFKEIIVSANRPYNNLMNVYKQNSIDTSRMFILDCISKNQNVTVQENNVICIDNVSSLTDISLTINETLNGSNEKQFVFFDSITTMLIHNKAYVFTRFIHNVLTKMRLKGVGGLLIYTKDNSNSEIRAEISQLCDKVIKI